VLEGSVLKSGNRIRITAELIDAKDGAHLWAERYDRAIDDFFTIQDEITLVLATEMQVKLTEGEQARLHYTTNRQCRGLDILGSGVIPFPPSPSKEKMGPMRFYWERRWRLIRPQRRSMLCWVSCIVWMLDLVGGTTTKRRWGRRGRMPTERSKSILAILTPTASSLILLMQSRYDEAVADAS
jgi:hypothetical protein